MGRLRARIRGLKQETSADVIAVVHPVGSASRFYQDAVMDCFLHESGRGRRAHFGGEPGEAHPLTVALRTATNLEALMAEQGTFIGTLLGEDGTMRGVTGRPGPPVSWNEEGTVCS